MMNKAYKATEMRKEIVRLFESYIPELQNNLSYLDFKSLTADFDQFINNKSLYYKK